MGRGASRPVPASPRPQQGFEEKKGFQPDLGGQFGQISRPCRAQLNDERGRDGFAREDDMGKAIRRDGRYSGLREGGGEWPEVLKGTEEIARFLRMHPDTAAKMLRELRLPGMRDSRGRWVTTRTLIEKWILADCKIRRGDPVVRPRSSVR